MPKKHELKYLVLSDLHLEEADSLDYWRAAKLDGDCLRAQWLRFSHPPR